MHYIDIPDESIYSVDTTVRLKLYEDCRRVVNVSQQTRYFFTKREDTILANQYLVQYNVLHTVHFEEKLK